MRTRKSYGCPVELALDVLGGKWKAVILARCKQGERRYGDLRREIAGISDKVLTQKLRELEALGLIERQADPQQPARSTYRLSQQGDTLRPLLASRYEGSGSV